MYTNKTGYDQTGCRTYGNDSPINATVFMPLHCTWKSPDAHAAHRKVTESHPELQYHTEDQRVLQKSNSAYKRNVCRDYPDIVSLKDSIFGAHRVIGLTFTGAVPIDGGPIDGGRLLTNGVSHCQEGPG